MALNVVVITKETIKPSLPTPQHLKNSPLSYIDQYMNPMYLNFILFYPATQELENTKPLDLLKKSLSDTLARFYQLAGRVIDNELVECSDKGVDYFQAHVRCELNRVLNQPKVEDLIKLLPCDEHTDAMGSEPLLGVQINKFECGGIAIAICLSHKVGDVSSVCTFANSWAKTASGCSEEIASPQFDGAKLFPPKQVNDEFVPQPPGAKVASRRFVFDSSKISALKAIVANMNPTRVEVVVAFLWRRALKASKDRAGCIKPSLVDLPVSLRGRMTPPLPGHFFGNLITSAAPMTFENEIDLHSLVRKLKEAKRKIKDEKVPLDTLQQSMEGDFEYYCFTSLCRFPLYEADFGWGKPIWATFVHSRFTNFFILMDTKNGDGIEAWVTLDEQDMARFEADKEFLG